MLKKPIKDNHKKIIFFTVVKKNFGNAHWLRTRHYASHFTHKIIWAFHDQNSETLKELTFTKTTSPSIVREVNINDIPLEIKKINPALLVFDLRELFVDFFQKVLSTTNCYSLIFDTQENEITRKINYIINPLPLLEKSPSNLAGLDYLKLEKFPNIKNKKEHIVFYFGTLDNPHYFRDAFQKVGRLIANSPELKGKKMIVIIENIHLPFLKVFVKTYLKSIEVLFKQRLATFKGLVKLNPILFITHYGISLLEALKNNINVLVFAPTKYHRKLTQAYFADLTYDKNTTFATIVKSCENYAIDHKTGAKEKIIVPIIKNLLGGVRITRCPICGDSELEVVHRRGWMNLVKCLKCQVVFQEAFPLKEIFNIKKIDYQKDYFLKDYEKQYQKTYVGDRENIDRLNNARIKIIKKFIQGGKLLDIGCALGFFLDIAKENGFETFGNDISLYATKKISQHTVIKGDFLKAKIPYASFQVITLWFVIEHFLVLDELLKKIAQHQEVGGVLAFSTPNGKGLSARFAEDDFLTNSPMDHYFILSSKNIKKLLKKYDYRLLKIKSTGIHFHRFKKLFPWLAFFIREKLYNSLASWLNWGDTIEVYASKEK